MALKCFRGGWWALAPQFHVRGFRLPAGTLLKGAGWGGTQCALQESNPGLPQHGGMIPLHQARERVEEREEKEVCVVGSRIEWGNVAQVSKCVA